MIFGVNLPNYSSLGNRDAMVAIAKRAEALGYSSLWTSDHILVPKSRPEPFGHVLESLTTLSYLAAGTERIRLGTGILVLPQRNPLLVAKQAATIQHLSGGRLTLGVAVGYMEEEYGYLRADFANRGRLADEYIPALRELFESDTPEFHGEHVSYADALFSPRPKVPVPIVVGGSSEGALKRAAKLGDGWYGLRLSPESARAAIVTLNELGHREIFEMSLRVQTRVGRTVDGDEPRATLHGDADEIIEQVKLYAGAGVHHLVIEPVSNNLDDFLEQLDRFAIEVAPQVATLNA
jgi:probable F420-dependent oxidoreductase